MRLLVTRSAEDAARTRAQLESAGHTVMASPLFEIVATGAQWPQGAVDALLVASAQSFSVVGDIEPPTPESRRLMPLFLVGGRTEAVAREHGFVGPTVVAPNASALAIEFEKLPVRPKRLLYLAGRHRKPDLEAALASVGQPVELVEVYVAKPVATLPEDVAEALRWGAIGGVLHYSRRTAELFLAIVARNGIDARNATHYCLSEDVAIPLRESGCPAIKVAGAPNEAALLDRIGAAA